MASPRVSQDRNVEDEAIELKLAHRVHVTDDVRITYGGIEAHEVVDVYRFKLNIHRASWSDIVTVCVVKNILDQPACAHLVTDSDDGLLHIPGVSGTVHSFAVDHIDHYKLILNKVILKSA